MSSDYQADRYWTERLEREFSLRGTGHQRYSPAYNRWLYRRKGDVLAAALGDLAPDRALDVGSGVGWVVEQLRRRGMQVDACDITQVAVDRLSQRFPGLDAVRADVGQDPLPWDPASFGVVTMLDVAYHITDDEKWSRALADLARVLRPGGRLVLTDRLGDAPVSPAPHVRMRSHAEWATAARTAGLELTRVQPLFRWLSRDVSLRGWSRVPDQLRGAAEYGLERIAPAPPHLRLATFVRR